MNVDELTRLIEQKAVDVNDAGDLIFIQPTVGDMLRGVANFNLLLEVGLFFHKLRFSGSNEKVPASQKQLRRLLKACRGESSRVEELGKDIERLTTKQTAKLEAEIQQAMKRKPK